MVTRLSTALPGVRVQEAPDYLADRPPVRVACEVRTTNPWRPLAEGRAEPAIAALLSSLYPLGSGETVRLQWIVSGTRHVRIPDDAPPELIRSARAKQSAPVYDAVGRIAVSASHRERATMLMAGVLSGLEVVSAPGTALRTRILPARAVARRIYPRAVPLTVWPSLLGAHELAAVVGIPVGGVRVPGLATGVARQLPPPVEMPRQGFTIGRSNYPGMSDRLLVLKTDDRLRHAHLQGPTGTGKSTLITHMGVQDIIAGRGVFVLDPKTDLIDEILARIPAHRAEDVIVINPARIDRPIGFNPLLGGHDEQSRELVVDRLTHILSELWRSSWGPRTADVIRSALLTLTHTQADNGEAFTFAELPELLMNSDFRKFVTSQKSLPDGVRSFWTAYEEMSEGERAQVIGPCMNKIRAILTRTSLRLMLGQSSGIDLGSLYRERKIILVPLSAGVIGTDSARMLGSFLVATLWQETQSRAVIPPEKRHAVYAYLDEFQDFVKFGASDLPDILAQSRGLGLGLILANQYSDQLPAAVSSAVSGTVRTKVAFQLSHGDAKKLAESFAPLKTEDLANLDAYEIAMAPCVNARTLPPVTGLTLPLGKPLRNPVHLADYSQYRYGTDRADVEAARMTRVRHKKDSTIDEGRGPAQ